MDCRTEKNFDLSYEWDFLAKIQRIVVPFSRFTGKIVATKAQTKTTGYML